MTDGVTDPMVDVVRATVTDAPLLANLLELYTHDLSGVFPDIALGDDGRFVLLKLDAYWSSPERNLAFLIRAAGRIAGFALVRRTDDDADAGGVFEVAEFFVLRGYRRGGIGRSAAVAIWRMLRGRWTVRVFERNVAALPFWESAVDAFAQGRVSRSVRHDDKGSWHVFAFDAGRDVATF